MTPRTIRRTARLAVMALACVSPGLPAAQPAGPETAALERALAAAGARGQLVERVRGALEFIPDNVPLAVPVAPGAAVSGTASRLPLRVQGSLDADGQLVLQDYSLDFAPDLPAAITAEPLPGGGGDGGLAQELAQVMERFTAKINAQIRPVAAAPPLEPRIERANPVSTVSVDSIP